MIGFLGISSSILCGSFVIFQTNNRKLFVCGRKNVNMASSRDNCRDNLKVKYGSCVLLFKVTKNQKLTAKVSGNCSGIVLADLLKSIGLLVDGLDCDNSVLCRKCARKIINCTTLYYGIKGGLIPEKSNTIIQDKDQEDTKTQMAQA
jgi:hypothetical protein